MPGFVSLYILYVLTYLSLQTPPLSAYLLVSFSASVSIQLAAWEPVLSRKYGVKSKPCESHGNSLAAELLPGEPSHRGAGRGQPAADNGGGRLGLPPTRTAPPSLVGSNAAEGNATARWHGGSQAFSCPAEAGKSHLSHSFRILTDATAFAALPCPARS